MRAGESVKIDVSGRELDVKFVSIGDFDALSGLMEVHFEVNGRARSSFVTPNNPVSVNKKSSSSSPAPDVEACVTSEKADPSIPGHVAASMPGSVVSVHAHVGDSIKSGEKLVILSAMKMETVISSSVDGVVARVVVGEGDEVAVGDLLLDIE